MFENPFKNKTVLVTGHTGFQGGWLSLWLNTLGAKVVGYSLEPPSEPNLFEAVELSKDLYHNIRGDVRDFEKLYKVFADHRPDMVFHLAAQSLVRPSYKSPALTYETNVMGTVNVLEAARQTKSVRVIVIVTSDKCYKNQEWIWGYRENDPMGGHDPYSSSKGCAELVTAAYENSFFPPEKYGADHEVGVATVRVGNVIGGGDWGEDRLIPDCVRSINQDKDIVIRYPKAIRPWQHVLEPLYGYLLLGAKLWKKAPRYIGAWNFGSTDGKLWTVEDIAKKICNVWGNVKCVIDPDPHPHEAHSLTIDSSKARIMLDWNPQFKVAEALEKTIDWYKVYYQGAGPNELKRYTAHQIEAYCLGTRDMGDRENDSSNVP